ncbi:hypothetical protein Tco_0344223 [Tanacetum coccineum]
MWSQYDVYDKCALWGVSHWGKKSEEVLCILQLRESARDVIFKKTDIIDVTKVQRGDFTGLRIQDIEDIAALLVQGKVISKTLKKRIAFNVPYECLRRSCPPASVEDLSNWRSHLREYRQEEQIDWHRRLHKFSDGTLDDVRNALNDRLMGIRTGVFAIGLLESQQHAEYDESNTYVLERFNTTTGNPVKKILLKLNLSDHRLFKDGGGVKEFQERCNIKAFQEWYEHVGPEVTSSQDGKVYKMAKRLCLVDDLKMLKITMSNANSRNKLNPEVNDHYNIFTRESQKDELKTKDEA